MNEELKALLAEAYDRGASKADLDVIVQAYNKKKKEPSEAFDSQPLAEPSVSATSAEVPAAFGEIPKFEGTQDVAKPSDSDTPNWYNVAKSSLGRTYEIGKSALLKNLSYGLPLSTPLTREVIDIQAKAAIDKIRDEGPKFEQTFTESIAQGKFSDAALQAEEFILGTAPLAITSAAITLGTGGAGTPVALALMGGYGAQSAHIEAKGEKFYEDMSPLMRSGYTGLMGGLEVFGEGIGGKILSGAVKKLAAQQITNQAFEQTTKEILKGALKSNGVAITEESLAEFTTGFGQSAVDQYARTGAIDFKEAFRQGGEGAAMGAVGGGFFNIPSTVADATALANSVGRDMKNAKARTEIKKYKEKLDASSTVEEKDYYAQKLAESIKTRTRNATDDAKFYEYVGTQNPQDLEQFLEIDNEIKRYASMAKVIKDPEATKDIKAKVGDLIQQQKDLESKYSAYDTQKETATPEATVETVEVAEAAPVAAVEDQAKQSLKQRTKEELATLNELELEEYNQLRRSIIKDITELSITDGEQEREGIRNKITNSIEKYNNLFEKDDRQEEAGVPSPIVEGEAPIEAQPIEGASQETPEAGGVLQVPIEEAVKKLSEVTADDILSSIESQEIYDKKLDDAIRLTFDSIRTFDAIKFLSERLPNYGKRVKGLEKKGDFYPPSTIKDLSLLNENESNEIDSIDAKINKGLIELSKIFNEPRSPETYRDGKRLVNELNNLSGRIDSIVKSVNDRYNEISGDLYKFDIVRYQMSEEDAKEYTALNERLREVNKYREARGLKIDLNRLKSFKASAEKRQREGFPYRNTPEELQEAIDITNAKLEALGDVVEIPEGTGPIELRIKDSIKGILSKYKTEEGVKEVKPTAIEEAPVGVTEGVKTSQPEPNKRFEEEKKRLQTEIIRLQEIQIDEISRARQAIRDVQGTDKLAKIDGTVVNEGTIEQIYGYYEPLIANLEKELRDLLKSSKPAEKTKVSPVAEPVVEVVTPIAEPTAVSDVKLTADDFFLRDPATKFIQGGVFSDVLRAILFQGDRFKSGRSQLYWYRKNIDEFFSTAAGETLPTGTTLSQMLGDSINFASIEKDKYEDFKEAVKKLGVNLDELTIKVAKTDRPSVYRDVLYDKIESQAPTAAVTPTEQPITEVVTPIAEPTAEVEATTAVSKEESELIGDIEFNEGKIEDLKAEIESEKGNIKEELERLRGEIVNVRSQKLPADEKRELIEDLKAQMEDARNEHDGIVQSYKDEIRELNTEIKGYQKKINKIREKKATAAPVAVPVAGRTVVEAVDISAENFAESFPSLFSFLKSGAVYRSSLGDSAGKKKELAKDRIKVDSLLKSAKVGLRDAKILIAVMSDYKPKKMADIAEFNRAYIEAENLLAKLEKLNKGNAPNTSSTKAEAIAKINSSNRLNQKQKEVMVTVVNSLKAEQLFILDLDIDEDGYGFANNLLTSKSAYSFIHEVGHWAYYNLLSAKDRIEYMDYMSGKFLNNEFTGLVYPVEGLATNAMDSYQEYFANQFDQWYTNQAGAENVLRTMFIKLKNIVDNLIKLFQSKGYNPDLIKYFDKIVDTTKFNMVPDKINQMDNKLINDEQLESESFGNSNELAREVVSQEKVEELDIKLETMLDKAKKAWISMWWNEDQGKIRVFKEQQGSLIWLEERKIAAFNNRLNYLLKGADKETIRIAFDLLSGKAEPEQISILEKKKNGSLIFGHVNLLRNYIDSLTESILFSPSFSKLPPTTQDAMIDNMGTYLRGSYRFWKDKKFFPSKELQTKAVQEVFDVKYSKEFARLVSLFDTKGLSDKVLSLENLYNQIKQNIIEEEKLLEVGQKTSEMKAMESNLIEIAKELSSERKNLKDQASLMKKLVGSSELTPENIKAFEAMKDDYIAESMASESNKLKAEARDEVKAYLEESKKLRESNDFKSGKLSSSSIKIPSQEFKRKKELLPSIKALLGEEKDPIIKFSDTAVALANIKHKGDMVYKISRAFKGKELVKNEATKSELATGEYRIVTDKFSPLNGKYISRQVFDAITDPDIYAAENDFAKLYFDILKFSRKSKTTYNPPGWGKNLRGGWFTMMANGVVNINVLRDLKRRGELLFNDMSDEETEQLIIEAASKGIMGQSIDANLIGGINLIYSRSIDGEDTDIDTLTNYVGKKLQKGKARVLGWDNWLSRKYGAIDDYTKLVIYRAEKLSFAKKLYGKDYKDLTADQQNEVMDAAAETVKRTTPTWSRLPPVYFKIAKTPFGDFLGFDFESIRSFLANFATGYSDLQKAATSKSLSKAQRDEYLKAGSRRLAGTASLYGLGMAITELVQQLMLDDDDELAEDLNSLAPDWAAGHKLVFTGINKDGIATFYDYTLEDPYAKMFDLTTGKYGLNRLVADYLSPNMAIGTIYNMTQGMDHYGRPISNSYDPAYIKAAKTFGYGAKETFIPPYVSSNVRDEIRESQLSKEQYNPLDAIGRVSSRAFIRDYKTNIGQQMYFTIKAFATKKEDYTDLSGMSRANRLRELDEIKRMYKAIGNVAMAKENYALYSDATKNIERYFNTPEKWYILYDYELPEEK